MKRETLDMRKYRPKARLYIALQELDFSWYPWEVDKVQALWAQGKSIQRIGKIMGRDPDEVVLLVMSLARENKIVQRPGGVLGLTA